MNLAPELYPAHVAYLQAGYEQAMAAHDFDAIVIASGAASSKNRFDDQTWTLSPTPAFTHWCPLAEADAFLVIRPGKRPQLVRTLVTDYWETEAPPESTHFFAAFELAMAAQGKQHDALPEGNRVAVITRDPGKSPPGAVNPPALIAALDALRTRKTAYEIECLAEATRRAVRGHAALAAQFASGAPVSELGLHLAYLQATEQDDPSCPYKNIVALGEHAAVLHYVAYTRDKVAGDTSLLVDAGAKCLGYGSDITRTYARGTSAGATRFAELLARMEALQQNVCARITVGKPYEQLHDECHAMLADVLFDTGIAHGRPAELVERGVTRAFLPHGLGHSLGVTVHDVGMKLTPPRADNPFLRNTSTIDVGQVFTIEPGFYIIDALLRPLQSDGRAELVNWAAIADLRPFGGIRIEDNIVVGAHGHRNLTREAYATAAA